MLNAELAVKWILFEVFLDLIRCALIALAVIVQNMSKAFCDCK